MTDHDSTDDAKRRDPSWRELLRELEVTPSKALGQNFLHDRKIVQRIANVAEIQPDEHVLEIGPGLGILTGELTQLAGSVTAVELDSRLARRLQDYFGDSVNVIEGDILEVDVTSAMPEVSYLVVANLPYSIATAAIQRLFEAERPPSRMVLMVQREVAERMTARPPEMSILAVAVQFYGTPKIQFRIGSGAFIPKPRVESAVVRIDLHDHPPLPREEHRQFFSVVRAGFAQRRKRLDNSISSALSIEKSAIGSALKSSGIDPSLRAETLSIADWVRLYPDVKELLNV